MDGPARLNGSGLVELQGVENLEKLLLAQCAGDIGDTEGKPIDPSGSGCKLVVGGRLALFCRNPFSKPYIRLGGWEV